MTTLFPYELQCAVCGSTSTHSDIGSSSTFGAPDLDLRPAELFRSTMPYWIQECPFCGYVSRTVADPSTITADWLKSEQYRSCGGIDFASNLAKKYYKYYMIKMQENILMEAYLAVMRAAWSCDDANDTENAKHCRELAISLSEKVIGGDEREKETVRVVKADLLRRTGQFERLIEEYEDVSFSEELLNQILQFQLDKAKAKDTACYTVDDVTNAAI